MYPADVIDEFPRGDDGLSFATDDGNAEGFRYSSFAELRVKSFLLDIQHALKALSFREGWPFDGDGSLNVLKRVYGSFGLLKMLFYGQNAARYADLVSG